MIPGIEKAWQEIRAMDPEDVASRSLATYDDGAFRIQSLGQELTVYPEKQEIIAASEDGDRIAGRFGYFFNLSVLWYLVNAKDIALSGRHIKPQNLKGGDIFFKGSHVLPMDGLAHKYGEDKEAFLKRAAELGGRELPGMGDAAVEMVPLPRLPVTLLLWLGDEEFPPRADILFDSTCEMQVALDIVWSVAMLSVLMMMQ